MMKYTPRWRSGELVRGSRHLYLTVLERKGKSNAAR